jgi:hypothetical protein
LFCYIEIDFDSVEIDWVGENEEEQRRIGIHNFSRKKQKANLLQPRRLGYDLVARATVSVKAASHFEVPLGFLRRGTRAIYDGQYIDGFYNLFFFLETLYAPGHSNPRRVKERLLASAEISDALPKARASFSRERNLNETKRRALLHMANTQLLEHMVTVRGNLHHHSLGRPGVWHPDKADQFREEALFLQHVVHDIALKKALDMMYESDRNEDLIRSAVEAGAVSKVRVEAVGLIDGTRTTLQPFVFSIPRKTIDRLAIDEVHRAFREQFRGGPKNVEMIEYKITSEDGMRTLAKWERVASSD